MANGWRSVLVRTGMAVRRQRICIPEQGYRQAGIANPLQNTWSFWHSTGEELPW
ncbi:hypothetical protein ACTVJH_14600 [Desulfoplanes sp. PS50]